MPNRPHGKKSLQGHQRIRNLLNQLLCRNTPLYRKRLQRPRQRHTKRAERSSSDKKIGKHRKALSAKNWTGTWPNKHLRDGGSHACRPPQETQTGHRNHIPYWRRDGRTDSTRNNIFENRKQVRYNSNRIHTEATERDTKEQRMNRIQEKKLHSIIFNNERDLFDTKESSLWPKKSNTTPKDEAIWTKLQDRNWFHTAQKCPQCKARQLTVGHSLRSACEQPV